MCVKCGVLRARRVVTLRGRAPRLRLVSKLEECSFVRVCARWRGCTGCVIESVE